MYTLNVRTNKETFSTLSVFNTLTFYLSYRLKVPDEYLNILVKLF